MFMIQDMKDHPTYTRLMEAAFKLKSLSKPAEVGSFLDLENPSQSMNAWRQRGVSASKITYVSRKIGCHPYWLEDGEGDMIYNKMIDSDLQIALNIMQPLTPYGRQAAIKNITQIAELIEDAKVAVDKK